MRNLGRLALSIGAAALIAGCGASQVPIGAASAMPQNAFVSAQGKKHSKTFGFTGSYQYFYVPKRVAKVTITASGGSGDTLYCQTGARGGMLKATIPVVPDEKLTIVVGAKSSCYGGGAYNGGGAPGYCGGCYSVSGGGGASDIREGGEALQDRVVVAGGGGGGGGYNGGGGGVGGGMRGGDGQNGFTSGPKRSRAHGGRGGTQDAGGNGGKGGANSACSGTNGTNGTLGAGGDGGSPDRNSSCPYSSEGGGGGGGGYYGGGGGGAAAGGAHGYSGGGGGGGGSSYAEPQATHVKDIKGAAAAGNGQIVISWR